MGLVTNVTTKQQKQENKLHLQVVQNKIKLHNIIITYFIYTSEISVILFHYECAVLVLAEKDFNVNVNVTNV